MRVIGFDNKPYKISFSKNRYKRGKSLLHKSVKKILRDTFPNISLYEEVTLPGSRRGTKTSPLIADFLIPDLMLVVEAHGEQHFKYTPYFHGAIHQGGKMNFALAKQRDLYKIEWCKINNIDLVALNYHETEDEWRKKLKTLRPMD